ncbi:hypothetical protein ACTG16_23790 [Aeromonas sp. 23P]|uniref:hypothetical protein n=1 Tax=Aeromonas sp. 23P TaxID=3452716 RepID=UPI003F7A4F79|nr:hypothetical protein [Aeromonas veronii]
MTDVSNATTTVRATVLKAKKKTKKKVGVSEVIDVLLEIATRPPRDDYKSMMVFGDLLSPIIPLSYLISEVDQRYGVSIGWLFDVNAINKGRDMDVHSFAGVIAKEVNGGGELGLEKMKRQLMNIISIPYQSFHDEMFIFQDLLFDEMDLIRVRILMEDVHGYQLDDNFEPELIKNNKKIALRDFARGLVSRQFVWQH